MHDPPQPRLRFAPSAWLKTQFLLHAGDTEVAGLCLTAGHDPLYVDDVLIVRQRATPVTVSLDDNAVADLFDRMVDAGVPPERFARVWLHTHPGASPEPSALDEVTFARAFGCCDWAVMAIVSRTAATFARLQFRAGPGGTQELPVSVDWQAWPAWAAGAALDSLIASWSREYAELVEVATFPTLATPSPLGPADSFLIDDLLTWRELDELVF